MLVSVCEHWPTANTVSFTMFISLTKDHVTPSRHVGGLKNGVLKLVGLVNVTRVKSLNTIIVLFFKQFEH